MPGRKKRSGAKRGKGFFSNAWNKVKEVAKAAHDVAKERKVISKTLSNMGHDTLAGVAKKLGYGRPKRRRAPRRRLAGRGGVAIMGPMGMGLQVGWGQGGRGLTENEKVMVM